MSLLQHSLFNYVLNPGLLEHDKPALVNEDFFFSRLVQFTPPLTKPLEDFSFVFFDFETTGLDSIRDRIIEVGALKIVNGEVVDQFERLTGTDIVITEMIRSLTGITAEMLVGKPKFEDVLQDFIQFCRGSILVAHNADFDLAMLHSAAKRKGIELRWPVLCTLKMSRKILPQLIKHNLDSLAQHFQLKFESRHRSIGDIQVTKVVFERLLELDPSEPETLQDMKDYRSEL